MVAYYDQGIKALVMDKGGITSHAAIIAQSLNIPCVVSAKTAVQFAKSAEKVIVDSNEGTIILSPSSSTLLAYKAKIKDFQRLQRENLKLKEQSVTKDGFKFHLRANVEFVQEMDQVKKCGADGIGLYEQRHFYMAV